LQQEKQAKNPRDPLSLQYGSALANKNDAKRYPHTIWGINSLVVKSRLESRPWAHAVRTASRTKGTASKNSQAGIAGLWQESSDALTEEPLTLLLEVDERLLDDTPPLFIFWQIIFKILFAT
jgi:hypothetical protein